MLVPCSSSKRSELRVSIVASRCESSRSFAKPRVRSPYFAVFVCASVRVAGHGTPLNATPRSALTKHPLTRIFVISVSRPPHASNEALVMPYIVLKNKNHMIPLIAHTPRIFLNSHFSCLITSFCGNDDTVLQLLFMSFSPVKVKPI